MVAAAEAIVSIKTRVSMVDATFFASYFVRERVPAAPDVTGATRATG
jgi:hypothetical protein